jgi:hypothetical protein
MRNQNTTISKRVRIRFKKQSDLVEGYLIFGERPPEVWHDRSEFAWFEFMLNDGQKTQKLFKTIDIERIDYLH